MPSSPQTTSRTILVINGPNLNLLGYREPQIYGATKLSDIEARLGAAGAERGVKVLTFQSNSEGAIVDRIHRAFWANLGTVTGTETEDKSDDEEGEKVDAIVINPGAYTHTSVAIRDALLGVSIPFIECHISNVHAREAFRHQSFLSDKAEAVIAGLGVFGYFAALEYWVWKWKGSQLSDAAA